MIIFNLFAAVFIAFVAGASMPESPSILCMDIGLCFLNCVFVVNELNNEK